MRSSQHSPELRKQWAQLVVGSPFGSPASLVPLTFSKQKRQPETRSPDHARRYSPEIKPVSPGIPFLLPAVAHFGAAELSLSLPANLSATFRVASIAVPASAATLR